jgi:hypothetical protein
MKIVQVSNPFLFNPSEETLRLVREAEAIRVVGKDSTVLRMKDSIKSLGISLTQGQVFEIILGGLIKLENSIGPFEADTAVIN